jgi:hypothetical protein
MLNGVNIPVCTTNANLNQRRVLTLSGENAASASLISNLEDHAAVGTQSYRGLKLAVQRRSANGVSLNGNYTWSRCFGLEMPTGAQFGIGFVNPGNPDYDRGHCDQDRTHLANFTVGYQTPAVGSGAVRAVVSNWRVSGILNARSGPWMTILSGRDNAFNGMANQRVDQVSDDIYGPKTLNNFLNPTAFGQPAPGGFGTSARNSIKGPGFHKVDLALSRLVSLAATRTIELRLEVFNLFNTFNWGLPNNNFASGTFGRITTMTGDPRIMQFGIKYGF